MSAKTAEGITDRLCARCHVTQATLVVRNDHLCQECFETYVTNKAGKHMDEYRVRGPSKDEPRKILLPLSLGSCSISLLHILDRLLRMQEEKTGRKGFELHLLSIQSSTESKMIECLDLVKQRYPLHTFSCSSLEDIYQHPSISSDGDEVSSGDENQSHAERLQKFFSSLPSATSKADMINVLRTRLVVQSAKSNGCECIVWGDSTTRLAEKTLAEAAKGRGFSLPWQTADGPSPHGVIFMFPMRDLLRKEIITYSQSISPPLTPLIVEQPLSTQVSASSKNTTIDDLMSQYFSSVEESYPSIVANVVRTSSRLQAPESITSIACQICKLPVDPEKQGLYGWGGDQIIDSVPLAKEAPDTQSPAGQTYCYGCARSMHSDTKKTSKTP
ncbi:MAG: cytoplasmic tRNA 2-thiolation protein 2 [Icmadophila ericetorum]|nr:cytoplasmic tRNA 2-thiolation protein 2 [Icmadophila ericetorum]